ncbi:MAG: hypothetical protein KKH83_05760 [Candidatus Margulisbacteria bacterium]|nr:hypothetical protein [Candidatus Margulisiibacteriota bacterium]
MKYFVDSQFERLYKKLGFQRQEQIKRAISELLAFFDSGVKTEGLGLKKLRKDYWEIRSTLKERILFSLQDDIVRFILVGDHESIRRFLKSH